MSFYTSASYEKAHNIIMILYKGQNPLNSAVFDRGFWGKMQKSKKIHIFSFLGLTLDESQHITPKLAALQRASLSVM